MWLKHCYLQGFVHVTMFDFLKKSKYQRFLRSAKQTIGSTSAKKCCNLQGFGAVTGKTLCKYQRFCVQKWPKQRYLQCFVPSTFSWNCKNRVNTSIFCDQPAKNAVICRVFFFAFKNAGICSVLCISSLKNIDIYSICRVFALLPQKTLNRKKIQHFVNFEKLKIVRKMCQNGIEWASARVPPTPLLGVGLKAVGLYLTQSRPRF